VQVRAVQGDTGDVGDVVAAEGCHLALLHNVLEYVDDPAASLADVVRTVRPGGSVSLLVANTVAAVLHRALAGHTEDALHLLESREGRWGPTDPMPRRFTAEQVSALAADSGLQVGPPRGVRVFTDLLPGRAVDVDQPSGRALVELEAAAADHPALSAVATQLHLVGRRPG
jgi:S-adenosylmethionine-dependent methyltransferase